MHSDSPCISPLRGVNLSESLSHTSVSPSRVYQHNGTVYKLFDTLKDKPNLHLVKMALCEAEVTPFVK
jgi:hypothetical protein